MPYIESSRPVVFLELVLAHRVVDRKRERTTCEVEESIKMSQKE